MNINGSGLWHLFDKTLKQSETESRSIPLKRFPVGLSFMVFIKFAQRLVFNRNEIPIIEVFRRYFIGTRIRIRIRKWIQNAIYEDRINLQYFGIIYLATFGSKYINRLKRFSAAWFKCVKFISFFTIHSCFISKINKLTWD